MRFPRPGACPRCGTFCPPRFAHPCTPPEEGPPPRYIKLTGQSPLSAWPTSARVYRDGGVWLKTPVPGIGPRMLALLARHLSHARRDLAGGKKARYGPSHALHDLVEMGTPGVLEHVHRPGPAWVPCCGTWHRVLLWEGQLTPVDHPELDTEAEEVAAAIVGRPLTGCAAAVRDWSQRVHLVKLPWLESLAALDAASSYPDGSLEQWDVWAHTRLHASAVAEAMSLGMSAREYLRWSGWLRTPVEVSRWREVGWTWIEAQRLAEAGHGKDHGRAWREAGLAADFAVPAHVAGLDTEEAAAWWAIGFPPWTAAAFLDSGLTLERVTQLRREMSAPKVRELHLELPF